MYAGFVSALGRSSVRTQLWRSPVISNLKALVVVLLISITIFTLAKPLCLRFVEEATYVRRRNIWIGLTIVAFSSPNIWLYALVAMPVMYWGAKKDTNPLAFYLLMTIVIPPVSVQIPTVLIGQLLELDQARMMAIVILIPLMARRTPGQSVTMSRRLTVVDLTLVAYGILDLVLTMKYEAPTNTARRALVYFLDTFVLFYAFARLEPSKKVLNEVVANFCLMVGITAAIGLFESIRGWLLYIGIPLRWGSPNVFAFLMRGDALRAQASTGHSLGLGYLTGIGLGFAYYMARFEPRRMKNVIMALVISGGMLVSYSRGGWLTGILACLLYAALRPGAAKYLIKAIPVVAILVLAAYNSPLKESVIDRLPIVGHTEQGNIDYREQLFEVSWRLIKINPWFGDPFVTRNMEELRQGQGIIDIVNGYLKVTLFDGLVGLIIFCSFFALALWQTLVAMRRCAAYDGELAALGAMLLAVMLASLFFVATAGYGPTEFLLGGIMVSYAKLAKQRYGQTAHKARFNAPLGT